MVRSQKTKKELKNLCKQETPEFTRMSPDKACFQHDRAYGKTKDLAKRIESDKVLRDK